MAKGNYNIIRRIPIIHRAIASGRYPNKNTLIKMISQELNDEELSVSTIGNDIEFLRTEYNAPIEFDFSKNGYYYAYENYKFDIFKPVQPFSITQTLEKEEFSKTTGISVSVINTLELYTHLELPGESELFFASDIKECGRYYYDMNVWIGLRKSKHDSEYRVCIGAWEPVDGNHRISNNFQMHHLNYIAEFWPDHYGYWLVYQFEFDILKEKESVAKYEFKKIISYIYPVDE